mmetsp:Transcript_18934/g.55580  ORF Transcript_18934/g.55580 Transcript_18934/m.55580 type:complete len:345 (+) Transcript_18934:652-1686(+)
MMSMWMSCSTMHVRSWVAGPVASKTMEPKTMPVSVDATLMLARTVRLSPGARVCACGRSQSLRSPTVASSSVRLAMGSGDWLTMSTSSTMSNWCTVTKASAYTGSDMPVSCVTRLRRSEKSSWSAPAPEASAATSTSWSSSSSSTSAPPGLSWRTCTSASTARTASGGRSGWRASAPLSAAAALAAMAAAPPLPLALAAAASRSAARSASSAALRWCSMVAKAAWQSSRKSADTWGLGRLSSRRHAPMRSAESESILASPALAPPALSMAINMDITSAATRFAMRKSDTCVRDRRASLVSVEATTEARKWSPPTTRSRSFWPGAEAAAAAAAAAFSLSAAPCEA